MMHSLCLVAQQGGGNAMIFALLAALVFFWAFSMWSNRKEKKNFQQMLDNLKKNDRVMTVGGILGSVVSATKDEVVLKVDESANVKVTFHRSAIKTVLTDGPKTTEQK